MPASRRLVALTRLLTAIALVALLVAFLGWVWPGLLGRLLPWQLWKEMEDSEQELEQCQTVIRWRIDAKVHVRGELLHGRIELPQALALFRWCNHQPEGFIPFESEEQPPGSAAAQELLRGCEATLSSSPPAEVRECAQLVVARLRKMLDGSEKLVLPEPVPLPGMLCCPD